MRIDESLHPAGILTKPLQGRKFVYKRPGSSNWREACCRS